MIVFFMASFPPRIRHLELAGSTRATALLLSQHRWDTPALGQLPVLAIDLHEKHAKYRLNSFTSEEFGMQHQPESVLSNSADRRADWSPTVLPCFQICWSRDLSFLAGTPARSLSAQLSRTLGAATPRQGYQTISIFDVTSPAGLAARTF